MSFFINTHGPLDQFLGVNNNNNNNNLTTTNKKIKKEQSKATKTYKKVIFVHDYL
jgi:hypothetical protein